MALAPILTIAVCWLGVDAGSASASRRGGGGGGGGFANQYGTVLGHQVGSLGAPIPLAGAVVEIRGPIIATATTGVCPLNVENCTGGELGVYTFFDSIPAGTYREDATYTDSGTPIACFVTQTRQTSALVTLTAGEDKAVNWTCNIPST
jgi:hypothetical protein